MDIPQRTMNAVGKRDEAIKRWMTSSVSKNPTKSNDSHFKIKFDNGSMLLSAVSSGDIEEVIRLLRIGSDVNFANADGLTSLHQACIDESMELVKILVESGANINARDNEGWTPLHAAASTTSLDIVKYLVEHGAILSAVNTDGELPVDLVEEDDIKEYLVDEITSHKINMKSARNLEHDRMLSDVMEWIAKGKITEIKDPQGATALHVAASKNYMDIMKLLIDKLHMDINVRDNDGWTPLHAAVFWKQLDVISYLLDNNADYQAKTTVGLLPLDLADDDIVIKYKNLVRKKIPSKMIPRRMQSETRTNESTQPPEKFPHTYKTPSFSILKKSISTTSTNINNTTTNDDNKNSTSHGSNNNVNDVLKNIRPPTSHTIPKPTTPILPTKPKYSSSSRSVSIVEYDNKDNSNVGGYENSTELGKSPIRPPSMSGTSTVPSSLDISKSSGIKLPPKHVSEHKSTPYKPSSINTMSSVVTDITLPKFPTSSTTATTVLSNISKPVTSSRLSSTSHEKQSILSKTDSPIRPPNLSNSQLSSIPRPSHSSPVKSDITSAISHPPILSPTSSASGISRPTLPPKSSSSNKPTLPPTLSSSSSPSSSNKPTSPLKPVSSDNKPVWPSTSSTTNKPILPPKSSTINRPTSPSIQSSGSKQILPPKSVSANRPTSPSIQSSGNTPIVSSTSSSTNRSKLQPMLSSGSRSILPSKPTSSGIKSVFASSSSSPGSSTEKVPNIIRSSSLSNTPINPKKFTSMLSFHKIDEKTTSSQNVVSNNSIKTYDEAIIEIQRLKNELKATLNDKKLLEIRIKSLENFNIKKNVISTTSKSGGSTASTENNNMDANIIEKLTKENKRLQQENATLIRAMSTHMKSKKDTNP